MATQARIRDGKMLPPRSIKEARRRHAELVGEISKIRRQIDDPNRRQRYKTDDEHRDWQRRARRVLDLFAEERRQLDAWIQGVEASEGGQLFRRAYTLLKELEADVDFEPEELALMRELAEHFGTADRVRVVRG